MRSSTHKNVPGRKPIAGRGRPCTPRAQIISEGAKLPTGLAIVTSAYQQHPEFGGLLSIVGTDGDTSLRARDVANRSHAIPLSPTPASCQTRNFEVTPTQK
jgi:hypothetical protein